MNWALGYIKKITDFQFLSNFTNDRKKVKLKKKDEETTNLIEKTTFIDLKLESSTLGVSSISHQSSSTSSSRSADLRNDEIIGSQQSSESSLDNSIYESVPTEAEADNSMPVFQRKKVEQEKNDEETTNVMGKTTAVALKLESSTLGVSSISHQSSSSSLRSADSRNDEVIESQQSTESSLDNPIFESVPTKAEADYSMQVYQRKKVEQEKNDEETNNVMEKTTDVALKLESSTLGVSSISHQSSSSSSRSADSRNDEIIESRQSSESSLDNSTFDSVPTKAEADYSMQVSQRKKVEQEKNDEETNNVIEKTTDVALKLESSTLGVSSISHPSSSSSSKSADSRNDEIIESQQSSESSLDNSIFESVPTKDEADYSMKIFQSFMNDEGPRMLVENPGFRIVQTASQFMKEPMVQGVVASLMCDGGVLGAVLRNKELQAFLRKLTIGNSTIRITNGDTIKISASIPKSSQSLISVILNWLLGNTESGMRRMIGILRSLVGNTVDSLHNENSSSDPSASAGQAIHMTILLTIINLVIVFVTRAIKR